MRCLLILFSLSCCFFISRSGIAQDSTLLPDKPGTINMMDLGIYSHHHCGYTQADTTENFRKLLRLIDTIRTNPVVNSPKGFDLLVLTGSWDCDPINGYGIPVEMGFEFCSWSLVY